jgi:serine/threonine-protein kinase
MINKIFRQRMEDPDPLETQARGVPASFAAIVRKLMSKNPEERHASCAELRDDLARWTDPARVRAILGAQADAARTFRPPPPELVEEDLRLIDVDDAASRDGFSLRDLGTAEPSLAPRHQAPMPPLPALIRSAPSRDASPPPPPPSGEDGEPTTDDSRWLFQFALFAAVAGLIAIAFIAIFLRF